MFENEQRLISFFSLFLFLCSNDFFSVPLLFFCSNDSWYDVREFYQAFQNESSSNIFYLNNFDNALRSYGWSCSIPLLDTGVHTERVCRLCFEI